MKIVILPSARDDLADGFEFYQNQAEGLGSYFLESLFSDIDSLILYAGIHRKVFGSYRLLSKRFPYAIYYAKESETAFVKAVLDCRKDPRFHRQRLRGVAGT
jgi:plasmid stabilization system protein ParE